jgi:hypothetical protein
MSFVIEVNRLVSECRQMDESELYDLYGIEIHTDGSVEDVVNEKRFKCLREWAKNNVAESTEVTGGRRGMAHCPVFSFDDE